MRQLDNQSKKRTKVRLTCTESATKYQSEVKANGDHSWRKYIGNFFKDRGGSTQVG